MDDYIQCPRGDTGYRSIHIRCKYFGQDENKRVFDGLKGEVQIRTALQHAWATAVEVADTFTGQALKSGIGYLRWKRFFRLASTAFALKEGTSPVSDTPTSVAELKSELAEYRDIFESLSVIALAPKTTSDMVISDNCHYFILTLDLDKRSISVSGYRPGQYDIALRDYEGVDQGFSDRRNSVLVRSSSVDALKRAYPNYFADTTNFTLALRDFSSDIFKLV